MSSEPHLQVSEPVEVETKITLAQSWRALGFVVLYMIAATFAVVVIGLVGLIELTIQGILPAFLVMVTVAVMVSLYLHLMRRNQLTFADLGFRRPSSKILHLLWQIPAALATAMGIQSLFNIVLGSIGINTTSDDPLKDIVGLPIHVIAISVLAIAVLTPIWEEVLYRGAFLDGFSRRFGSVVGIALSSALFAISHMSFLGFAYLFTLGIALALIKRFHQNIWAPIILHAVNNGIAVVALFMTI
jgi:membrane protease YdiL (CAAX protease family)